MASPSSDKAQIPDGALLPSSTWGEFNNMAFMVQQALGKMQTATLVRIESCTNSGGMSPVGYVDVTPLVNQLDGQGNPTPHVTIYNVPYFRLQGGANGIIIDPQKGDIGVAVFASRDISQVKATRKQGNPGSHRQYSFADGMYLGGMLNGAPTRYIRFDSDGNVTTASTYLNWGADGAAGGGAGAGDAAAAAAAAALAAGAGDKPWYGEAHKATVEAKKPRAGTRGARRRSTPPPVVGSSAE